MKRSLSKAFSIAPQVAKALAEGRPVVALESAVVTHGLPYPQNVQGIMNMEKAISERGAVPAVIAVLDGTICVGVVGDGLERLAKEQGLKKLSSRDLGVALAKRHSGGTTVAGTLVLAQAVGIRVFATGGIGGVHRGFPWDVSADLTELGRTPVIVVCAGAKAILDLPATVEYLETNCIPVIGFQTDEFPAFYVKRSGLGVSARADSVEEIAVITEEHIKLGNRSAILVVVPPPDTMALSEEQMEVFIQQAILDAEQKQITGQAVTPFLLARMAELTKGYSLAANLSLLRRNAEVAAEIACALTNVNRVWI